MAVYTPNNAHHSNKLFCSSDHKHKTSQAQTFSYTKHLETLAEGPICTFPSESLWQSSTSPCPVLLFHFSSPLFSSTWPSYSTSKGSLDRSSPTRGRFDEILTLQALYCQLQRLVLLWVRDAAHKVSKIFNIRLPHPQNSLNGPPLFFIEAACRRWRAKLQDCWRETANKLLEMDV